MFLTGSFKIRWQCLNKQINVHFFFKFLPLIDTSILFLHAFLVWPFIRSFVNSFAVFRLLHVAV